MKAVTGQRELSVDQLDYFTQRSENASKSLFPLSAKCRGPHVVVGEAGPEWDGHTVPVTHRPKGGFPQPA
jgi:hypothetical protein